jgi:large subunit ribosomal protein L28
MFGVDAAGCGCVRSIVSIIEPHCGFVLTKEATVASVCDVCGKGPGFGMSVSHSHRRTHRRFNPNVQTVRAMVAPGNRKRITVCTSCLKAGKVVRA